MSRDEQIEAAAIEYATDTGKPSDRFVFKDAAKWADSTPSQEFIENKYDVEADIYKNRIEKLEQVIKLYEDALEKLSVIQMPDKPVEGKYFSEYVIGYKCSQASLALAEGRKIREGKK